MQHLGTRTRSADATRVGRYARHAVLPAVLVQEQEELIRGGATWAQVKRKMWADARCGKFCLSSGVAI